MMVTYRFVKIQSGIYILMFDVKLLGCWGGAVGPLHKIQQRFQIMQQNPYLDTLGVSAFQASPN